MTRFTIPLLGLVAALAVILAAACGGDDEEPAPTPASGQSPSPAATPVPTGDVASSITVYSGRSETLVQPIIARFTEVTGISVGVRYGDTAELAATIMEEGRNSPADVFFAQDAGALGALAIRDMLAPLPDSILQQVPSTFRSPDGFWAGISGRARVVAYNTDRVNPAELPESIWDFTESEWRGRIGWPPTNGSFQAFVTALRLIEGEEGAERWLEGIKANNPRVYENNTGALQGVAAGEVDVAFINHYYLYRFLAEQGEGFKARNHYLGADDPGSLVNIAGLAILNTSGKKSAAERFIEFMLSAEAQEYFSTETFEYPLVEGVSTHPDLPPLSEIDPPDIDLSDLADLEGTLDLLRSTGVLP